jgi:hypothetical protein
MDRDSGDDKVSPLIQLRARPLSGILTPGSPGPCLVALVVTDVLLSFLLLAMTLSGALGSRVYPTVFDVASDTPLLLLLSLTAWACIYCFLLLIGFAIRYPMIKYVWQPELQREQHLLSLFPAMTDRIERVRQVAEVAQLRGLVNNLPGNYDATYFINKSQEYVPNRRWILRRGFAGSGSTLKLGAHNPSESYPLGELVSLHDSNMCGPAARILFTFFIIFGTAGMVGATWLSLYAFTWPFILPGLAMYGAIMAYRGCVMLGILPGMAQVLCTNGVVIVRGPRRTTIYRADHDIAIMDCLMEVASVITLVSPRHGSSHVIMGDRAATMFEAYWAAPGAPADLEHPIICSD